MKKLFFLLPFLAGAIVISLADAQEPKFNLTGASGNGRSGYNAANPDEARLSSNNIRNLDQSLIKPAPAPAEAVAYALADIAILPKSDQPFHRYIWVPDGNKDNIAEVKYALNLVGRGTVLYRPKVIGGGRLVRIDLRMLAPRTDSKRDDLTEIMRIWEKYSFDPYFHIIKTTDDAFPTNAKLLKRLDDDPEGSKRLEYDGEKWFVSPGGKTYQLIDEEWVPKKLVFAKKEKIAVAGAHVGLDQHVMLQGLTQSNAPVVRYDWWLIKTLTVLDGGLYYEWIGAKKSPDKNKTDLQFFLDQWGAGDELIAGLRSDQRAAMFKSRVTGRPRRIDVWRGRGVRPDSGTGIVSLTYDSKEGDLTPETDPFRSLLELKAAAGELILEGPNGMHKFALFKLDDQTLQDSAPDNVVKDHTIPAPHTARLEPAISCIRCHAPFDGWQPFQNEVRLLLSAGKGGGLDVFDDLSQKKRSRQDILDRLAGLYSGDLTKTFRRGRDDYSDAVFQATDGMSIPKVGSSLSQTFVKYRYTEVDAYTVCTELGYDVPRDKAVYYLNLIIPPLSRDIQGIAPEDPIIGALKMGLSVQRFQWELVYPDAALRAMLSKRQREQKQQK